MTGTGTGAGGGQWRGLFKSLGTRTTLLAALTILIHSAQSSPINRQVGISENVYITVQNDTYGNEQRVCSIDSVTYEDGESIPTSSPCEHCICRPPGFACTIISCEYRPGCKALKRSNQCCPEYQCECEKDGKIYQNGEKILDNNNPCEVCYCQGGDVICAVIDCYWRSDCQPRYIENRCCPLYDHCPPPSQPGPMRPTQRPLPSTTAGVGTSVAWFNLSSSIFASSSTPFAHLEDSTTTSTTTFSTTPAAVLVPSTTEQQPESSSSASVSISAQENENLLISSQVPEIPAQSQTESSVSVSTEPSAPVKVEIPVVSSQAPVENEAPAVSTTTSTELPEQKPFDDSPSSQSQASVSESPVPVVIAQILPVSTEESITSTASPSVDKISESQPEEPAQVLPSSSAPPALSDSVHDSNTIEKEDVPAQTNTITSEVLIPELPVTQTESSTVEVSSASVISTVVPEVMPTSVQELPTVEGTPLPDLSDAVQVEQLPLHDQSSSVDTSLMESISEKSTAVQATESLETVTASSVLAASPTDTIIQASQSEIINPTLTTPSVVVVEATTLPSLVLADPVHIEQSDADTVTEQNIVKESSADVSSDISSTSADEILPAQDDAEPSVTEKLEITPELTPVIPEVEASTAESTEILKPSHPALYPGLIPTPSNMLQPPSKPEEDSQNEISVEDQKPVDNLNAAVPAPPATELLPPIHEVFIPDTTLAPAELPSILSQTKPEEEAASPIVNLESHLTHPTELKIESSSASDKIIQPSSASEVAPVENSHENEVASVSDSEALNDDVTTISSVLNDAVVSESSSPFPVELEVVSDVSSTKNSVSHLPETETEAPVVQDQPAPAVQESNTEIPIVSDYVSHDVVSSSSSTTQTPDLGVEVTNAVPVPVSIATETSENLTTPQSDSSADGNNEIANANVIDSAIAADEPQASVASTDSSLSDDVTESGVVVKSSTVPQAESAVNVGVTDVNNLQDENTESSPNSESDDQHDPINEHSDGLEVTTPQVLRDVTSQGQSQVQEVENKILSDSVDSSSSDVTTRQPELEILNDATQSSTGETDQIKYVPSLLDPADQIQSDEPVEGTAATTENNVQSDEPSPVKAQETVAVEEKPHEVPQSSTTDQDTLSDDQGEESEQTTVIISSQKSTQEEVKSEVHQLPSLSDLIVGSKSKLTPVRDSVDVATVQPENVEEKQNQIQENQSPSISINNDEPVVVTTSATIGSEDAQFDESETVSQNQIQNQPQPTTTVNSVVSHGSEIAQVKEQNDEPEVGTTSQPLQFDATGSKIVDAEIQSDGTEQEVVTVRQELVEKVSPDSSESKFRLDPSVFNDSDSDSESETSKEQPAQPEVNNLEVLPVTTTTRSEVEQPLNDEEVLTTTTPAPAVDPRTSEIKANAVTDDQIIFDDIPTHSPDQLRSEPLVNTNAPSYDGGVDTATPAADEAESVQTTEITRNNNNNADILQDNTVNIELTTTRNFLGAERADLEFDDEVVTEQPVAHAQPQQDNANNVLVDVSSSKSESDSDSDLAKPTEAVLSDEKAEENEQTTTETTVLLRHHLPGHIHENYNLEEETTKQPQEKTPADIKFKSDNSEEVPASTDASILALTQGQERADLPSETELDTTTVLPSAEKEARDDIDDIVPATTNAADSFDEPVSTALPSDLKTVEVDAQHDENESDSDLPVTTTVPLFRDDIEVAETAADDVATTFASVYTREDNSSDLVDNESRINETQGEPLRKILVPTQNVIIPSELVKRLDPISDDLGDNGLGRSDLSLQSLMKDEASSADETWFWRAMNRIRQLPDFLPTLTRQPRSTAFNSYKPELVKPNKTKKATDSVPKKHIPIGSRFIFW